MKPRTIKHYIKEAFRSLVMNRLMSFASILTVASCIFIVSIFYILAANIDYFLHQMEGNISIIVFVEDDVSAEVMQNQVHPPLVGMPQIQRVEFIHRNDALEGLFDDIEDGFGVFESFRLNNPLPHTFELFLYDLRYHEEVMVALREMPELYFNHELGPTAEIMTTVRDVVQIGSLILVAVLAMIAVVLIMNTIRITVSSRQVEIGIMKYVGATDWFIRWPFIIEGLLIGFIGGMIPALACRLGYGWLVGAIEGIEWLNFLDFMPGEDIFTYVMPLAVGLGVLIGLVGSAVSVRRYLKV